MRNKILLSSIFLLIFSINIEAQIPNYHRSAGKNLLFTYTDLTIDPQNKVIQTVNTFQYGITEHFSAGVKITNSNFGFVARNGYTINEHFGIGLEVTPRFDLNNSFKYLGLTSCLAANGNIYGKWGYVLNTCFSTINKFNAEQYLFLSYDINLNENWTFIPLIGAKYNWNFAERVVSNLGFMLDYKGWCLYVWGIDLLKHPTIELCIDVRL